MRLVQIPTITSVDAGFTDAIGVRATARVRYVGKVVPNSSPSTSRLIPAAPPASTAPGSGTSCPATPGSSTAPRRLVRRPRTTPPWDHCSRPGRRLLDDLEAAADEIRRHVSADGVRFLADVYRHIGAACAAVGHSRFEEGSEHFWAYGYEHSDRRQPVHGEIISLAVCAHRGCAGQRP